MGAYRLWLNVVTGAYNPLHPDAPTDKSEVTWLFQALSGVPGEISKRSQVAKSQREQQQPLTL